MINKKNIIKTNQYINLSKYDENSRRDTKKSVNHIAYIHLCLIN